jgi:hypothetical protein
LLKFFERSDQDREEVLNRYVSFKISPAAHDDQGFRLGGPLNKRCSRIMH